MRLKAFLRNIIGIYTFEDYRIVGIKLIKAKGLRRAFLKIKQRKIGYKRGIEIENWANIGENFILAHPHGVIVNQEAKIGNNVKLYQNVTVGVVSTGKRKGAPNICDGVTVYPGAVIVGGITVGENVTIAPNSFVNFDVPAGSLVIGNPGEIVQNKVTR